MNGPMMGLAREAAPFPRRPAPGRGSPDKPLLLRAKEITNWFDGELAAVVGMKRATVQAYLAGRTPEYLSTQQKQQLLRAVQDFVRNAQECLDEMELFA